MYRTAIKTSNFIYKINNFHRHTAELPANRRIIGIRVTDWYGKDIQSTIKCQDLKHSFNNTTVIKDLNWDFKIFFLWCNKRNWA